MVAAVETTARSGAIRWMVRIIAVAGFPILSRAPEINKERNSNPVTIMALNSTDNRKSAVLCR